MAIEQTMKVKHANAEQVAHVVPINQEEDHAKDGNIKPVQKEEVVNKTTIVKTPKAEAAAAKGANVQPEEVVEVEGEVKQTADTTRTAEAQVLEEPGVEKKKNKVNIPAVFQQQEVIEKKEHQTQEVIEKKAQASGVRKVCKRPTPIARKRKNNAQKGNSQKHTAHKHNAAVTTIVKDSDDKQNDPNTNRNGTNDGVNREKVKDSDDKQNDPNTNKHGAHTFNSKKKDIKLEECSYSELESAYAQLVDQYDDLVSAYHRVSAESFDRQNAAIEAIQRTTELSNEIKSLKAQLQQGQSSYSPSQEQLENEVEKLKEQLSRNQNLYHRSIGELKQQLYDGAPSQLELENKIEQLKQQMQYNYELYQQHVGELKQQLYEGGTQPDNSADKATIDRLEFDNKWLKEEVLKTRKENKDSEEAYTSKVNLHNFAHIVQLLLFVVVSVLYYRKGKTLNGNVTSQAHASSNVLNSRSVAVH